MGSCRFRTSPKLTLCEVPLNFNAWPSWPMTRLGPLVRVPVLTLPERSYAVSAAMLEPSNDQYPTRPSFRPIYMGRAMMVPALALEVRAKNRNAENKVVIIICFTSFKILDIRRLNLHILFFPFTDAFIFRVS